MFLPCENDPLNITTLSSGIDNTRVVDTGTVKFELAIFVSVDDGIATLNVSPFPLVNTMFGDEYDAVISSEPVFVAVPTAEDAVTNN